MYKLILCAVAAVIHLPGWAGGDGRKYVDPCAYMSNSVNPGDLRLRILKADRCWLTKEETATHFIAACEYKKDVPSYLKDLEFPKAEIHMVKGDAIAQSEAIKTGLFKSYPNVTCQPQSAVQAADDHADPNRKSTLQKPPEPDAAK